MAPAAAATSIQDGLIAGCLFFSSIVAALQIAHNLAYNYKKMPNKISQVMRSKIYIVIFESIFIVEFHQRQEQTK